jgi:tRNA 2-thiouridine synthesizing protein A
MTDKTQDSILDVTDLLCPLPVLKARKRLEAMASGSVLQVVATDPMSVIDMPHFCLEQGHSLLSHETDDRRQIFRIKRK